MKKRGIALAADSAVARSDGKKVFHAAEKLFSLSPSIPVAIMTFGAAEMMNVPWETIIRIYADKLNGRKFETLEQYATHFLSFIEGETSLFPGEDQRKHARYAIGSVWSGLYLDQLAEKVGKATIVSDDGKLATLIEIIKNDHEDWMKYPDLDESGLEYGSRVVETYEDVIAEVEAQVFEGMNLPPNVKSD